MKIFALAFLFACLVPSLSADDHGELARALDRAVNDNDAAAVRSLLEAGADPNLQDNEGRTALLRTNRSSIIPLLIQAGADPAIKDNEGRTVLHRRAWRDDISLLDELLALGCPLDDPDIEGRTPLWNAAAAGHSAAILALLARGADPNSHNNRGSTVLFQYLWSIPRDVKTGSVPSDEAETVVAALLAAGARPEDADERGNSALSYALTNFPQYRDMRRIQNMVAEHADADARKTAEAAAAHKRRESFRKNMSYELPPIIGALSLPLLLGGLSIGMREGVYRNDLSANFMGYINGALTIGAGGFTLGFLAGILFFGDGGAQWSNMFDGLVPIAAGLIGTGIGLVGGLIIAALPQVRNTFNEKPVLYYTPTVFSGLAASIIIISIRLN